MGRIPKVGLIFAAASALAIVADVVWVDRALAEMLRHPDMCLTKRDRELITRREFPADRQDRFVTKTINFHQGVPGISWWHLRGMAIHLTYVTFWSREARSEVFVELTSRMRDCSFSQPLHNT